MGGYQLWLSFAARDEMVASRDQHLSQDMTPVVEKDGVNVAVISGHL